MRLLTGNDLPTGDVVWWTGTGWSRHVEDAVDVGHEGEGILRALLGPRISRIVSVRLDRPCGRT